jgi:VanZ family protein
VKIPLPAARAVFWCAAFWLAALAVLVLMLLPAEHVQRLPFNFWDKAQHSLAFGVLTLLGLLAWSQRRDRWRLLVGLVIYGGAIEWAQHLTGWRHGDWVDWVADSAGVALVAGLALARRRRP